MRHSNNNVLPAEKLLSVLSYFTMGIIGIVLCIIARLTNRKLRYFLMYNVKQSVAAGVLLFLFDISVKIILFLISHISFLDFIAAVLNLVLSFKILTVYPLGISFSFFQLCILILLFYICIGVCFGKIFHVFYLTKLTQNMMKNYNSKNIRD